MSERILELSISDRIRRGADEFKMMRQVRPIDVWVGRQELVKLNDENHFCPRNEIYATKEMQFAGMTLRVMESPGIRVGISIEA